MTRPPVDVRRAGSVDVEDLLVLWGQARDEAGGSTRSVAGTAPEHLRPRLREALLGDDVHVLVARLEGSAVGYAMLRVAPVFAITESPCLHVEHLFVTPPARRRGVAKALLSAVASVAERCGADQVITSVPPAARDSHRFLARLGFSPLVVRRVASTAVLRRKLAGESRRGTLDDLLSRRRSLRGKASWTAGRSSARAAADPALLDPAAVIDLEAYAGGSSHPHDTLEMPVVPADLITARPSVSRVENPSTQPV